MKLDDRFWKGQFRMSMRLNDGLPKNDAPFLRLNESLELHEATELNIDTDAPKFKTFLKYESSRDFIDKPFPRNLGDIKIFIEKIIVFTLCLTIQI